MIHIETSKKSYDTSSITLNETPSSKGLYYINDAENHGIYCSDNFEITKKIYEYAMEKVHSGETINTKDLKKKEIFLTKQQEKDIEINTIEKDWEKVRKDLEKHLHNHTRLLEERKRLSDAISKMEENKAPEDVIILAKKVVNLADDIHNTSQTLEKNSLSFDEPESVKINDNSYIIYKLENKLLTRANSAFKAGLVNAYDKLHTPLMKLHQYSLENQIQSEKAELALYQKKLDKYLEKKSKRMEKRLDNINAKRMRRGLEPFPPETSLFLPREQEKINRLTFAINDITNSINKLSKELELSKDKHLDRIQYVKDHKAIAKNEKILDKHKKVVYQKDFTTEKAAETGVTPSTTNEINSTSAVLTDKMEEPDKDTDKINYDNQSIIEQIPASADNSMEPSVAIPIYSSDGEYLGEQVIANSDAAEMAASSNAGTSIPEAIEEPSIFSPVNERFTTAKEESKNSKDLVSAKLLYRVLEQKLPLNSMIEFEAGGSSYIANCNEYGEFGMKQYHVESAKYETISKENAIQLFRGNIKEFNEAVQSQLGEFLIRTPSKEKNTEQTK